jgi:hypothetical protein
MLYGAVSLGLIVRRDLELCIGSLTNIDCHCPNVPFFKVLEHFRCYLNVSVIEDCRFAFIASFISFGTHPLPVVSREILREAPFINYILPFPLTKDY